MSVWNRATARALATVMSQNLLSNSRFSGS